jgi:hypothetical protein
LRALAVIFRQRWEGFQILAKHLKAADLAIATQERAKAGRHAAVIAAALGQGEGLARARHGRHSSINPAP